MATKMPRSTPRNTTPRSVANATANVPLRKLAIWRNERTSISRTPMRKTMAASAALGNRSISAVAKSSTARVTAAVVTCEVCVRAAGRHHDGRFGRAAVDHEGLREPCEHVRDSEGEQIAVFR